MSCTPTAPALLSSAYKGLEQSARSFGEISAAERSSQVPQGPFQTPSGSLFCLPLCRFSLRLCNTVQADGAHRLLGSGTLLAAHLGRYQAAPHAERTVCAAQPHAHERVLHPASPVARDEISSGVGVLPAEPQGSAKVIQASERPISRSAFLHLNRICRKVWQVSDKKL